MAKPGIREARAEKVARLTQKIRMDLTHQRRLASELLTAAARLLEKAGVSSPRREAELLLAHVLRKELHELYLGQHFVRRDLQARFEELILRRAEGEPLQWLMGRVEFLGLPFKVAPGVFIPRPETEILAEAALERMKRIFTRVHRPVEVLDLGTGSGVLGVSLTKLFPDSRITATDASAPALALAYENAMGCGVEERVCFAEGDWFDALAPFEAGPFDLIVCNPPYIPTGLIPLLSPEVRRDPWAALNGGADGLCAIRKVAAGAPKWLVPGGWLCMEIGDGQWEVLGGEISSQASFKNLMFVSDLHGTRRVLVMERVS